MKTILTALLLCLATSPVAAQTWIVDATSASATQKVAARDTVDCSGTFWAPPASGDVEIRLYQIITWKIVGPDGEVTIVINEELIDTLDMGNLKQGPFVFDDIEVIRDEWPLSVDLRVKIYADWAVRDTDDINAPY